MSNKLKKYIINREETGSRFTTVEVWAEDEEEAKEALSFGKGTIVSRSFKQRDANLISIKESKD